MRFRQAMSVLARAMEAVAKLRGIPTGLYTGRGTGLCSIALRIKEPKEHRLHEPTYPDDSRMVHFKDDVARLCVFAGVTPEHARQLREHIEAELGPEGSFLHNTWASAGRFGLSCDSTDADCLNARISWLRTLGRGAPAKVKHAAE